MKTPTSQLMACNAGKRRPALGSERSSSSRLIRPGITNKTRHESLSEAMQAGANAASRSLTQPSCSHPYSESLLTSLKVVCSVPCTPVDGVGAERQVRVLGDVPFVRGEVSDFIVFHPAFLSVSSNNVKQANRGADGHPTHPTSAAWLIAYCLQL